MCVTYMAVCYDSLSCIQINFTFLIKLYVLFCVVVVEQQYYLFDATNNAE